MPLEDAEELREAAVASGVSVSAYVLGVLRGDSGRRVPSGASVAAVVPSEPERDTGDGGRRGPGQGGGGGGKDGGQVAGVSRGSAVPQPAKRARPQEMTKRDEEYVDQKYDYDVEESP